MTGNAKDSKERRNRAKQLGLCPQCCERTPTVGPKGGVGLCDVCRKRQQVSRRKAYLRHKPEQNADHVERYHRLKSQGLCVYCGNRLATAGVRCTECVEKERPEKQRRDKIYYRGRRADLVSIYGGECIDCHCRDHRVIEFHHTNFDGHKEKSRAGADWSHFMDNLLRDALEGNVREDIVPLCANCHRIRHWEHNLQKIVSPERAT